MVNSGLDNLAMKLDGAEQAQAEQTLRKSRRINFANENIDARLMAANQDNRQKTEDNRENETVNGSNKKETDQSAREQSEEETADELNKKKQESKKKGLKEKMKDKFDEKIADPAKMATKAALSFSWKALIPSWGLTLIYPNIHAAGRAVVPQLFSKLSLWDKVKIFFLDLLAVLLIIGIIAVVLALIDSLWHIIGWFDWFSPAAS